MIFILALLASPFVLLPLLVVFWAIDREFFGKWGRRLTLCLYVSMIGISIPVLRNYSTGCAEGGRFDSNTCALSIVTAPLYVLFWSTIAALGLVVVWAVVQYVWKVRPRE